MKLKTKHKINVFKKLLNKRDGVVLLRYIKEELGIKPEYLYKFFSKNFLYFIFNPSALKHIDLLLKINRHLSKEEKKLLIDKLNQIPKPVTKALVNPLCEEELEIKYGLYETTEELKDLIHRANQKLGIITKAKRSMEK